MGFIIWSLVVAFITGLLSLTEITDRDRAWIIVAAALAAVNAIRYGERDANAHKLLSRWKQRWARLRHQEQLAQHGETRHVLGAKLEAIHTDIDRSKEYELRWHEAEQLRARTTQALTVTTDAMNALAKAEANEHQLVEDLLREWRESRVRFDAAFRTIANMGIALADDHPELKTPDDRIREARRYMTLFHQAFDSYVTALKAANVGDFVPDEVMEQFRSVPQLWQLPQLQSGSTSEERAAEKPDR